METNRLGEMLLDAGLIDQFQLESALSMQRNLGGRIGSALVKLGYLPEETIMEFIETQAKYARVSLAELEISDELKRVLPYEKMLEMLVIPIDLRRAQGEKILRVAMTDPTNIAQIDALQFSTGCRVLPVLAGEEEIDEAIRRHFAPPEPASELVDELAGLEPNAVSFDDLPDDDPRFQRLLDVLQHKGLLTAAEAELIKFG